MDPRLAVCNFLSKLSGVKGRILELRNKSIDHRHPNADMATLVSSQIAKISNDIDEYVTTSAQSESPVAASHVIVLEVMKQECIIALNRPLLTMSKDSSDYKMGVQLCIGAARAIVTTLTKSLQGFEAVGLGQDQSQHLFWPSFTWAVWMSSFVVIYAGMEEEMSTTAADRLVTGIV